MDIIVNKITGIEELRGANTTTLKNGVSNQNLETAYLFEHSPIRTQVFYIKLKDIYSFVSVHLVRHKIGVEHFVETNRADRGGDLNANRWTPVDHLMVINAQALINMMRDRLCLESSKETRTVCRKIVKEIAKHDSDLAKVLVPNCVYRNGICNTGKKCGKFDEMMEKYSYYKHLFY